MLMSNTCTVRLAYRQFYSGTPLVATGVVPHPPTCFPRGVKSKCHDFLNNAATQNLLTILESLRPEQFGISFIVDSLQSSDAMMRVNIVLLQY